MRVEQRERRLGHVALLVRDYDEAITYFRDCLDFTVVEDSPRENGKRWVIVAPASDVQTSLLLARAATPAQSASVGNQAGGRVFLFLHTEDFLRDYERYRQRGVVFEEAPREEPYGTVAVFRDLYGNRWDLLQLR